MKTNLSPDFMNCDKTLGLGQVFAKIQTDRERFSWPVRCDSVYKMRLD